MANWLSQHPQVYFSKVKEPHYFSRDLRLPVRVRDYSELFASASSNHIAIGEGSTEYIYSDHAIQEINELYPAAKFIAMIRNPADLIWSWHHQVLFSGWHSERSFERAWRASFHPGSLEKLHGNRYEPLLLNYAYVGSLGARLQLINRTIPSDRLHIIIMDDLRSDPREVWTEVCRFLNVDTDMRIDHAPRHVGIAPRLLCLSAAIRMGNRLRSRLKIKRKYGVLNLLNRLNKSRSSRDIMDVGVRRQVLEYFEADIRIIERIMNRDLTNWRDNGDS